MNAAPALLCVTLAALSTNLVAQNTRIYRCGPEGRELSQMPCRDAQVLTPKVDTPDAEQRRQAEQTAQREAQLGDKLEKERLQSEQTAARNAAAAGPAGIHGRGKPGEKVEQSDATASENSGKKAQRERKPKAFVAVSPKPAKEPKRKGERPGTP